MFAKVYQYKFGTVAEAKVAASFCSDNLGMKISKYKFQSLNVMIGKDGDLSIFIKFDLRNADGVMPEGVELIDKAIKNLSKKHQEHIEVYGHGLDQRLTGDHETCNINEFKAGVADRGCSIRIPRQVEIKGYGYLEDRRPGANSCPYQVAEKLVSTILEIK